MEKARCKARCQCRRHKAGPQRPINCHLPEAFITATRMMTRPKMINLLVEAEAKGRAIAWPRVAVHQPNTMNVRANLVNENGDDSADK
jgi:hypothetical protein